MLRGVDRKSPIQVRIHLPPAESPWRTCHSGAEYSCAATVPRYGWRLQPICTDRTSEARGTRSNAKRCTGCDKAARRGRLRAVPIPLLRPGTMVLDCGCGAGTITLGLAEVVREGHVVGVYSTRAEVGAVRWQADELSALCGDRLRKAGRLVAVGLSSMMRLQPREFPLKSTYNRDG